MADGKHIRTEAEHEAAMKRIYELMDSEPDTTRGGELDALVSAVEEYESRTVAIGGPEPVAAIEFRMGQAGLHPDDLIPCLGSREAVSEVLSGRRRITFPIAVALQERLGIPVETLLAKPATSPDRSSVSRL